MRELLASDLRLLVSVVLATVLAIPIGWDREQRDRPAGLRTHLLIASSAATFTGVALAMLNDLGGAAGTSLDPMRALQAVATGIGFIGAGTIFMAHDRVRGLTTAASLLATAAIGVACGAGHFVAATGLSLLVGVIVVVLRRYEPSSSGPAE